MVQPDGMADDLTREPVAVITAAVATTAVAVPLAVRAMKSDSDER